MYSCFPLQKYEYPLLKSKNYSAIAVRWTKALLGYFIFVYSENIQYWNVYMNKLCEWLNHLDMIQCHWTERQRVSSKGRTDFIDILLPLFVTASPKCCVWIGFTTIINTNLGLQMFGTNYFPSIVTDRNYFNLFSPSKPR